MRSWVVARVSSLVQILSSSSVTVFFGINSCCGGFSGLSVMETGEEFGCFETVLGRFFVDVMERSERKGAPLVMGRIEIDSEVVMLHRPVF